MTRKDIMYLSESTPMENLGRELTRVEENLGQCDLEPRGVSVCATAPGPVVLFGAPGVGKGTQADALTEIWCIPKISTGEILRTNVAKRTVLGIQAEETMRRGGLVLDRLITEMVASRLSISDTAAGFILDGFPRTVQQVQWLEEHLATHRNCGPLAIIHLYMEPQKIIARIIHRRVCLHCNAIYNTDLKPPKQNGRCDKDGSALVQRGDDRIEVLRERLDLYKRETEPLIERYRSRRSFMTVDADRPALNVTKDIVNGIALGSQLMERK